MRSVGVKPREGFSIIAACFGDGPERAWFTELQTNGAALSLTFVDKRVALIRRARALEPTVVLLPLRDASGMSSAPLIARLRVDVPTARVIVLLTPGASRAGLAEAIRAGAEVAMLDGELVKCALFRTNEPERLSARDHEATRALLSGLQPAAFRESVVFCVMHAHRRLSVADVANFRGLSACTLGRHARAANWPTPCEVIRWGGLLRASILQWREPSTLAGLSRASGFASARSLQRIAERLLQRPIDSPDDLSPLLVSSRLHRRVLKFRH